MNYARFCKSGHKCAIIHVTGLTLPAVFLLMCGYYGNSVEWAIIFLSLSVGCSGFAVAAYPVNNLDLAPKYAGILLGIANTMGTIPGFLGPQIAKLIAKKVGLNSLKAACMCIYVTGSAKTLHVCMQILTYF